jgi:hypothetical protein
MAPCTDCGCDCGNCKDKSCECECHTLDGETTTNIKEVAGRYITIHGKMTRQSLICAIRDSGKAGRIIKKIYKNRIASKKEQKKLLAKLKKECESD